MDKKLKEEWIEALEGEYASKKGTDSLECEGKYCCLGVLQMITIGHVAPIQDSYGDTEEEMPTFEYLEEIGLTREQAMSLAKINDATEDFGRVVLRIKENV